MIKISLKGLAKYMTANSSQQRKILHDYKYPDPEGQAQAVYYREARDLVVAFHRHNYDKDWLLDQAAFLDTFASQSAGRTKTRYRNNARALIHYALNFSRRRFKVLREIRLRLVYAGVQISVAPDLHVEERGKEKIIKVEFTRDKPDDRVMRIVSQAMFEAQLNAGMGLTSAAVLYMSVSGGDVYRGARAGSRLKVELEAACQNIAGLWKGI